MKCVYRAESLIDAHLFADCLRGNGVPCAIFQGNAVGALGELPVIGPEVWIHRDHDVDLAFRLVARLEDDLIQQQTAPPFLCDRCGESSPAGFDICWSCRHSL